jgi:hypothetical protein
MRYIHLAARRRRPLDRNRKCCTRLRQGMMHSVRMNRLMTLRNEGFLLRPHFVTPISRGKTSSDFPHHVSMVFRLSHPLSGSLGLVVQAAQLPCLPLVTLDSTLALPSQLPEIYSELGLNLLTHFSRHSLELGIDSFE